MSRKRRAGDGFKMEEQNRKIIKFRFKGKNYIVKDYALCEDILSQTRGLMFRSKNYKKPLLFVWKTKEKRAIHSFFCRRFLAIWMLNNKIIEIKLVKPWKFSITPKGKFNFLLEVPLKKV